MAISYELGGVSWWSWQETSKREWWALGSDVDPIRGAGRSNSGYPVLSKGSRGDLVVWAQEHLRGARKSVPVTGYFGNLTRRAVRRFQRSHGQWASGRVGPPDLAGPARHRAADGRLVEQEVAPRREAPSRRPPLGLAAGRARRDPASVRAVDPRAPTGAARTGWWDDAGLNPTQQLAEFLALISCFNDERTATRNGIERVAEVLHAEAAALVRGGSVIAAVGFAEGQVPTGRLVAVADRGGGTLAVPGTGDCVAAAMQLEDERPRSPGRGSPRRRAVSRRGARPASRHGPGAYARAAKPEVAG